MTRQGRHSRSHRRGSVLIVVTAVLLVLTSLALVFGRAMRVESQAAANHVAALQAEAIARGAAEYVRSIVTGTNGRLPDDDEIDAEATPLGGGYFWLLKPDPTDDRTHTFGLIDEAGKLNINTASPDMLSMLPGMNDDLAASVVDWRDADDEMLPGGAESQHYLLLSPAYHAKNDLFETVEELLRVKGMTPAMLYGEDANRNGVLESREDDADRAEPPDNQDGALDRGLWPFVTVYSIEPAGVSQSGPGSTSPARGRVNVNTAPREVLRCLPGLDETDVDAIVSQRLGSNSAFADVPAFLATLPPDKGLAVFQRVTTLSYVCSADIVAVDGTGRGFRRFLAVFDTRSTPARIVHWRDLTALGWPLDPEIRKTLRAGGRLDGDGGTQATDTGTSR